MSKNINIKPCKNNVGAFINIDINNADQDQIIEIQKTVNEFGVIFFRKQKLTSEGYLNFAKKFGEFFDYPMLKGLKDYPNITVVEKFPIDGKNEKRSFCHK